MGTHLNIHTLSPCARIQRQGKQNGEHSHFQMMQGNSLFSVFCGCSMSALPLIKCQVRLVSDLLTGTTPASRGVYR